MSRRERKSLKGREEVGGRERIRGRERVRATVEEIKTDKNKEIML